ncbi:hypothetical protein HRbin20_01177 [bacterium HR20]|nr:hypothetical protein HRbin20_01177 [bacterium HR20]
MRTASAGIGTSLPTATILPRSKSTVPRSMIPLETVYTRPPTSAIGFCCGSPGVSRCIATLATVTRSNPTITFCMAGVSSMFVVSKILRSKKEMPLDVTTTSRGTPRDFHHHNERRHHVLSPSAKIIRHCRRCKHFLRLVVGGKFFLRKAWYWHNFAWEIGALIARQPY